MYLGIDVGGTKTLVAVLDEHGKITEQTKFPTPKKYDNFLLELQHLKTNLRTKDFKAVGAGIPVSKFDRQHGRALKFGNLPWNNVPVQADLEKIFRCPVAVENDAKLAALSESKLLHGKYNVVLYITVSTGIGIGLVANNVLDTMIGDGGGRTILLENRGEIMPWEDFAGGRAIVEIYGKRASEITDEATWRAISRDLAKGFIHLIAIIQPEVIVIGGSVGTYFERYGELLAKEIAKYKIPMVTLPVLRAAARPESAVLYGCYEFAKQSYGHASANR